MQKEETAVGQENDGGNPENQEAKVRNSIAVT